MQPRDVPDELLSLYLRMRRQEKAPALILATLLNKYDDIYTAKMQAFWQVWDNGWALQDETPTLGVASKSVGGGGTKDSETRRRRSVCKGKKVRVTSQLLGTVTVYPSVKAAAEGEGLSPTTVRAKLKGEYNTKRRLYEPIFELVEE